MPNYKVKVVDDLLSLYKYSSDYGELEQSNNKQIYFCKNMYPSWFPYPRSWMSAFFLSIIAGGLSTASSKIAEFGFYLARHSPRLDFLFIVLAALSPIFFIAVAHHWLHIIIDRLTPDTQSVPNTEIRYFPGMISWWEGLYGWVVITLSLMITVGLLGFLFPYFNFYRFISDWHKIEKFFAPQTLFWVAVAAYLYHFEHLVRQRLSTEQTSQ